MATPKLCSIEGCGKTAKGRGWCSAHYERWKRHGDPMAGGTSSGELLNWIVAHASSDSNECIPWPYARNENGRGIVRYAGGRTTASRVMCTVAHGPPPTPEHEAAHSCGRGHEGCMTPRHLRWATTADNQADRLAHGTDSRGGRHGQAKLTEDDVRHIRRLEGTASPRVVGTQFGVSRSTVRGIFKRQGWAWLD